MTSSPHTHTNASVHAPLQAQQLIENVPGTAFQDNDDIPRALDRFLEQNSVRLFALEEQKRMLEMAKKCTVTVTAEEAGLAWGAKLDLGAGSPAEERVLVYLVYLLLINQKQRHVNDSPSSVSIRLTRYTSLPRARGMEGANRHRVSGRGERGWGWGCSIQVTRLPTSVSGTHH